MVVFPYDERVQYETLDQFGVVISTVNVPLYCD